ncbi:hypothetical protein [Enterococcus faecalis]|uniref:hypothetical protein n=1 Tax=Enterococcus faecalis TaxID=1351 RepID=UPI00288D6D89|nr:hypothetical protein [Enterococcus faecalis]MDT2227953.1 hypothetical protein [Enterococcus faecalis]
MELCYWELNPEILFRMNPHYKSVIRNNGNEYPKNVLDLISIYNEYSEKCIILQRNIDFYNFKNNIVKLFEYEAVLSEISYYLSEVDLTAMEEDMHTLIQQEYLIDYYYKLENAHKEGNFLVSLLKSKVLEQRQIKFGLCQREDVE